MDSTQRIKDFKISKEEFINPEPLIVKSDKVIPSFLIISSTMIMGITFHHSKNLDILTVLLCLACLFVTTISIVKIIKNKVQVEINSQGIYLPRTGLIPWTKIRNTKIHKKDLRYWGSQFVMSITTTNHKKHHIYINALSTDWKNIVIKTKTFRELHNKQST